MDDPGICVERARLAFEAACNHLGVAMPGADLETRGRLVDCIIRLMQRGEYDVGVLHRRAVIYVSNTNPN